MEIILAPSDIAIIWAEMQGEEKDDGGIGSDNQTEELKKRQSHC